MDEKLAQVLKRLGLCARCRQCRMVSERPLPKVLLPICPSGEYYKFDAYYASGRVTVAKRLLRGDVGWDDSIVHLIYSCVLCKACQQQCPITEMDPLEATMVLRELAVEGNLVNGHYRPPGESPLAVDMEGDPKSRVGLFIGCEGQADRVTVEKLAWILGRLGLSFQVLDGCCCGAYRQRRGDQKGFEEIVNTNAGLFSSRGITRIICHDPMCYKVLKQDYALERRGIEVQFYVETVVQALKQRRLVLRADPEAPERVSYHDPCYLGRYAGMYDLPREVIGQIYGGRFVELERNRENALCCGGAPDWSALHPAAAEQTGKERVREAEGMGVARLITSCARCVTSLRAAAQRAGSPLEIVHLVDVLAKAV